MFDKSIDGWSSCYSVVRTVGGDTERVHDITFVAFGATPDACSYGVFEVGGWGHK